MSFPSWFRTLIPTVNHCNGSPLYIRTEDFDGMLEVYRAIRHEGAGSYYVGYAQESDRSGNWRDIYHEDRAVFLVNGGTGGVKVIQVGAGFVRKFSSLGALETFLIGRGEPLKVNGFVNFHEQKVARAARTYAVCL
jgi:hypothetical protein